MAVGKEIKVTLSLDDSGFSIKTKGAGDAVRLLERNLGSLTGQTGKTEAAIADLSSSVKGFSDGFGTLQKSLQSSLDNLTRTVANSFSQLSAQSKTATKQVKDEATAQIDARKRVLQGEVDTNQKILSARVKNHADLRRVEEEMRARALAAQIKADSLRQQAEDARRRKRASSPFIADANALEQEAARLKANAEIARQQVTVAEQGIHAMRTEQAARLSNIASLDNERKAALADADAKRTLASIAAAVGKSNDREVARTRAAAAQRDAQAAAEQKKSAENMARYKKQLSDQELRDAQRAEAERTRAAREAAAERRRIAAEEARAARAEAKAIADMWRGMAKMYAGSKIEQGIGSSVDNASDYEKSRIMVQALNLPKDQEQALFGNAKKMSAQLGFATQSDVVKSQMSAISSLGYNHTDVINDTLAQAMKAANNMELLGFGHGDMQSTLRNIYGVTEMRQQTGDSGAMLKTFDLLNKSLIGTAGKVTLADVETVLRRVGAGASTLSDEGLINLVGLADQFKVAGGDGGNGGGVSTVGTIIKMMQAYATGKGKSNNAVKEFAGAGILDEKGLDLTKDDGNIFKQAKNGSFKNVDEWLKDPVKAMQGMIPQIVAYTRKAQNKENFYRGRDDTKTENQMLAVIQYLQRLGITQSASQAVVSVGSPAAAERLKHQSETINNADNVNQTAARLQDSFAGKMQETSKQWDSFKTIVGDSVLPVLKTVLEYATKLVIVVRDFADNNPLATTISTITAAFGGVILSLQGFLSMFGSAGILGAIRAFIGLAPAAAGGAGLFGLALGKVTSIFKTMAAVMLAWDVGYMIGTWLNQFKPFGLSLSDYFSNLFMWLDNKLTKLMLDSREKMIKLRNFVHYDSDEETAAKMAQLQKERAALATQESLGYIEPPKPKKPEPKKPEPKKLSKEAAPGVGPAQPVNEKFANQMAGAADAGRAGSDRDPLNKALSEELGRMNSAKTKLDALVSGGETVESLRQQAVELVKGKWAADDLSKDHSKKNRPDWNSAGVQKLVDATADAMLYGEQIKAIEYANERVAATSLQANVAMNTLEHGGVAKQTDAFKALSSELARTEERLGAGTKEFEKWNIAKSAALYNQARADNLTFALGYQDKNRSTAADLLPTERERLKAKLAADAAAEDAQIRMRQAALDSTYENERRAISGAKIGDDSGIKNEQQRTEMLIALDANYQRTKDDADKQYTERRRLRAEEEARQLESAATKMAREWHDTQKALDDIGTNAMNSFVSMITNSLSTGRLAVGDFIKGVLMDIANAKLKETLANPLRDAVNTGASWVGKNLFGMAGGSDAASSVASTTRATADTAAATATNLFSTSIMGQAIPALELFAARLAAGSGGGIGAGLGGFFSGSGASDAVDNYLFANGGIMTSMGPMQLRKYANGGIANSPQVAIYGEAGPEAYVPLPDGRSIPVTMKVQGGGQAAAAPSVAVNVINQTNQSVNAQQSGGMRFDGRQYVLDVVLSAASTPGSFRSSMKDALK